MCTSYVGQLRPSIRGGINTYPSTYNPTITLTNENKTWARCENRETKHQLYYQAQVTYHN